MDVDYPYHLDVRGHTAETTYLDHIRDMIEQILFTSPSERVNRPDFGSGLQQLVHDPNSPELAEAVKFSVSGALDRWLGDVVEVVELSVESVDSSLCVWLTYRVRQIDEVVEKQRFDPQP